MINILVGFKKSSNFFFLYTVTFFKNDIFSRFLFKHVGNDGLQTNYFILRQIFVRNIPKILHSYEVYPYGKIRKTMNIIRTFELNFNISHVFCE